MTTFHICIPVQKGIEELKKGRNYLTCSPSEALKEYTDREAKGIEFFTGCSREDKTGRCKGHKTTKKS